MISSISAWSGSAAQNIASRKVRDDADGSFYSVFEMSEEAIPAAASAQISSLGADNGVKSSIVAGSLDLGSGAAAAGPSAPSAGGAGGAGGAEISEESDGTEVIYSTTVLPDGSKLVQMVTKFDDGSTKISTMHVPAAQQAESFVSSLANAFRRASEPMGSDEYVGSGADALARITAVEL